MSIADYGDLMAQVSSYTGRDDFAQNFQRFVSFAEMKFNRALKVAEMEFIDVLNTDEIGAAVLPTDYQEMREVANDQGKPIELIAITAASDLYRYGAGKATSYAIIGDNFYCVPYGEETFQITYYGKIPPLSVAAPSNWLLDKAPLVYLYGVCAEVAAWALASGRDPDKEKVMGFSQALGSEIESLKMVDNRKRWSNARVVFRGVNP